jgi:ABC-2 type transport system permease protein
VTDAAAVQSERPIHRIDAQRVRAIVRRHAYVQKRGWHRWFDILVWPTVDTVIWGSIGQFVTQQGGAIRSGLPYMLTGILLMHVLYQANISVSTGFMEETWSRNLLNMMVTPTTELDYMAGIVLMGLAKLAAGLTTVALAAFVLYSFNILSIGPAIVPIIGVLMLVGWCIALFVMGFVLRFGNGAEILAWGVLFVVVALSGVFYPVTALPGALQPISNLLPSTHALIAARTVLDGQPLPWDELARSAIGLVFFIPLSMAYLNWMLRTFRARGYVTRYS